ncbi:MAG: DNA gyrase inhibitor YacG [Alphaproteobacteria bacterium]|nr:DNA gyrase inhibitor YacG [Alphaproteobacteria bacterium]
MSDAPDQPQACPICGKPAAERFRPFCSARCKDVDLNRWFSGAYAIPGEEAEELPDGSELARGRRDTEGGG